MAKIALRSHLWGFSQPTDLYSVMIGCPMPAAFAGCVRLTQCPSSRSLRRDRRLTKRRIVSAIMVRNHSGAAERNKDHVLRVLQRVLPAQGRMLELASGTGQHVAHFARSMPAWSFHPTEPVEDNLTSIDAWAEGLLNVKKANILDVVATPWNVPDKPFDAVFNANMIHISPWAATEGLMRGAADALGVTGKLVMYGPYVVDGETAESNRQFSRSLQSRDPSWGVRELNDVKAVAEANGLVLQEIIEMPANNLSLVFAKNVTE